MGSSAFSGHSHHSPFGPAVSEKLMRDNFILWKAQIMPGIRAARIEGYLDGTCVAPAKVVELIKDDKTKIMVINPEYEQLLKEDNQLLERINNSLSKGILGQVTTMTTSTAVWTTIENMSSAQSQACVTNLRMQLANCKKGAQTAAAYYAKIKSICDELASAGKPVPDCNTLGVTARLTR